MLTFSDSEETVFKRAVSLLADELQIEAEQQSVSPSALSFQGLEILQHQHSVLRDRRDVRLTRLEYGTFVTNVIYNLRKKIEPDCKNRFN